MNKIILLLMTLFILSGCGVPPITMSKVNQLEIGMTQQKAMSMLNTVPVKKYTFNIEHKKIMVEVYLLSSGDYFSNYLLAYNVKKKLIYWGYPNEFARSSNPLINKIGRCTVQRIQKEIKQ